MSDLIDRQALRNAMYHEAMEKDSDEQKWDSGCWIRYKMFERVVDSIPSSQPEIILCRDCKNWDTSWNSNWGPKYHYCPMIDQVPRDDFYCADAERRTDD